MSGDHPMPTPSLDSDLRLIGQLQPHLPAATSLLVAAVALGAVTLPFAWPVVRHLSLIAHEGAHAVLGSGMGHKIGGVRLRPNGTGATAVQARRARGPGIAATLIGYLGPSLFGLGAAKLIAVGHIVAVLWLALLALALMLPLLRNGFGFLAVILTGLLIYLVARYATAGAQAAAAYGIAWLLLMAGIRVVLDRGREAADADALRQLTRLPQGFWALLWLICTVIALGIGGRMLL